MAVLRGRRGSDGPFVESPMRDNWYQASSYWPSSFALVTTVDESGVTNVAPYQLTMPFDVIGGRALLLISRPDSNTAHNLRRTGIASLNYVECTRSELKRIVTLGYPGQSAQDKVADNPFTLVPSPTPERAPDAVRFPPILDEAFQVYECVVDTSQQLGTEGLPPAYFVLRIERILLRQRWAHNIETGAKRMPRMPITFGFRGGEDFWFAQVRRPFRLKTPRDRGPKEEAILYEANRIDPEVQFTREACQRLTGIPKPFVKSALRSMVEQAKDKGVGLIDVDFVDEVNRARQRS